MIRDEFREVRGKKSQQTGMYRILVTMGGADPDNTTLRVINALRDLAGEVSLTVVLGGSNPHEKSIREAIIAYPHPVQIRQNISDMAEEMAACDLLVTAAGSTTLEALYLGVPMLTIVLADNQRKIAETLDSNGWAVSMGWHHRLDDAMLRREVGKMMQASSQTKRPPVGEISVADVLVHTGLRPTGPADRECLYAWVTDPQVRQMALRSTPISHEEHCRWFEIKLKQIAEGTCRMYCYDREGIPAGQVRLDRHGIFWVVDITVSPKFRGYGVGKELLKSLVYQHSDSQILAYIKPDNTASIRLFESCGFVYRHRCGELLFYLHRAKESENV